MFSKRRKPPVQDMKALSEAGAAIEAAPPAGTRAAREPEPEPEPPRSANVISGDAEIRGSIVAAQDLEIAGIVHGDVECHARLIVVAGGEIHGQVSARELVVDGLIEGDVEVSGRLAIGSHGRLLGDVTARAVSIEEGAIVRGSCAMGRRPSAPANDEPETIFLSRIMDDDDDVSPGGLTAVGA